MISENSKNHAASSTWTLPAGPHAVDPVEPIYGPIYMPRKFKMAIALADDNCVDLYANDIGLMAIIEGDKIIGYNVVVGGSMGCTPSTRTLSRNRQANVLHSTRAGDRRLHGDC